MVSLDDKILRILQEEDGMLKIKDLKIKLDSQDYFDISYSTIDSSILRLAKKEYIIWEKYKQVKLTQSGINRALELKRHALSFNPLQVDSLTVPVNISVS